MLKRVIFFILVISSMVIVGAGSYDMNLKWSYEVAGNIDSLYIEDIDNDGFLEIVIFAKNEDVHGPGKIYVLDKRGLLMWDYELDGPQSVCVSDVNHDLFKEVVLSHGGIRAGIGRGGIDIIDKDGKLSIQFPAAGLKSGVLLRNIKAVDLDKNGHEEIIGNTHDTVNVLKDSYDDFSMKIPVGKKIEDISLQDLDRDGYMDVIANCLYDIYDISIKGLIRWNYTVGEGINTVTIADLYPWGNYEVILVSKNDTIYILDDSGILRIRDRVNKEIINLITADFDDDGLDELVLGTNDSIYFLDVASNISYEYKTNGSIKTVLATALEKKSELEIFASDGNRIYEIARNGSLLKRYELNQSINKIYLKDLESNGVKELIASSDNVVSVYGFEVEEKEADNKLAKRYYDRAYLYLSTGYPENASFYAEKALAIYSKLNDPENVHRCKELLQRIEDEIKEEAQATTTTSTTIELTPTTLRAQPTVLKDYGTIIIIIAIILALIGTFLVLRRGKKEGVMDYKEEGVIDYREIVNLSIKNAKSRIMEIENPDYDKIIELERAGKNRKSFIGWLERQKKR